MNMRQLLKTLKKYIQDYHFNSLLIRNFGLIFGLTIIPVVLLVSFYYINMKNILESEIKDIHKNASIQAATVMDSIVETNKMIAIDLSLRDDINLLIYRTFEQMNHESAATRIIEDLTLLTSLYDNIDSIYVYFEVSETILSSNAYIPTISTAKDTWLSSFQAAGTYDIQYIFRKHNNFYPYILSILCPIYSSTGKHIGTVAVNMNIEDWGDVIDSTENMQFFCIDFEQKMYYANNYSLFNEENTVPDFIKKLIISSGEYTAIETIEGEDMLITSTPSAQAPWKYISLVPFSMYNQRLNQLTSTMAFAILLLLMVCLIVSCVMTIHTYRPVLGLIQLLDEKSEQPLLPDKDRPDEFLYIAQQVLNSHASNHQLQKDLQQKVDELNDAQLLALQTQLDPHYLCNTLDTINWMIIKRLNGKNEISDMISDLGRFFRLSLKKNCYLVNVAEEIDHTKLYLKILDIRYKDRLKIIWDIDDALLHCKIPKLALQPIVENAVMHGLCEKRYFGTISIRGMIHDQEAVIAITDNGIGMTAYAIQHMNECLQNQTDAGSHIGLQNVHKRFVLLFGTPYGVFLQQADTHESGLTVLLKFPCM